MKHGENQITRGSMTLISDREDKTYQRYIPILGEINGGGEHSVH